MHKLVERSLQKIDRIIAESPAKTDSLFTGSLGRALYYSQLYLAYEDNRYQQECIDIMEKVFDRINTGKSGLKGASLATGMAGFACSVNFLTRYGVLDIDTDEAFDALDEYLYNSAMAEIGLDFMDFIYGAFGSIHYFVRKGNREKSKYYLNKLVDRVLERVVDQEQGTWIPAVSIKHATKDVVDMGLAHGQCGMLLILIEACELLPQRTDLVGFIRKSVEHILTLKEEVNYDAQLFNLFPFQYKKGVSAPIPNRLAWCYSDLNEVLLFYKASRLLQWPQLKELADLIGMETLMRRDINATMVSNTHFCHGSSGVAQIYRILFRETGLQAYKIGYEHWIEQTVLMADEELQDECYQGKESDLLEGWLGVGLTLLSFVSIKELGWSSLLLLQ